MIDEERIEISESQLKEAKQMVEESDIKYDEVSNTDTLYSSTDTVYFLKTILSPRIGLIDSVI